MSSLGPLTRILPDRERSLRDYSALADHYDASCRRTLTIREAAVEALAPRAGETVFDVACGTGTTLLDVARRTGPQGRAIGIEHSPEMAAIARAKIDAAALSAEIVVTAVEDLALAVRADAMLFCYTHDVLQSERAIAALLAHAKPGCRFALTGMRFVPWAYGWPLNLFKAWRARHYVTTFTALRAPYARLEAAGVRLEVLRYYQLSSAYLAIGLFEP